MVRPDLQESRIVELPVKMNIEVYDLNNDGISEVVAEEIYSGQGTVESTRSIVQFSGWHPIVLHQTKYGDNEGATGKESQDYHGVYLHWGFKDLDGDGQIDLLERVITGKGRNGKTPETTDTVYRWYFATDRFTEFPVAREK